MAILGPCDDLETFLKNLDEHKLVDLCADLLTIRGHSDITITDGPGDGQRDIHSKDEKGEKYLTQSKFHKNSSKTVSAKELGETVLGMVRFGYHQGIFITNAKVSPQAKRDALNDYPGYNIEFLDGRRLIEEVFQNLILKAIWYDGVALDTVQYSVVFPMVARDLELDKPLSLSWLGQEKFQGNSLATGRTRAQIRFVSSTGNVSVFGNRYRTPRRRTFYEHGSPRLEIIETILTGEIHLEDIEIIIHKLQEIVTKKVIENQPSKKHIALIVGFPSLTPFGGEATGARIELSNHRPTTIVCHEGIVHNEWEWLLPKEDELLVPQRLRASETSLFCYYIPKHDICFDMILVPLVSKVYKNNYIVCR
ncbi:restriction endonuclease [Methanoculleus sp.]|uniref:restriction endonuclease n=1 Tax=Methanoculleus sp. TaxID=90427 RepID=UPI001BD206B4|nr:restriction endonuclease [Methanoculleus sp.]